MSKNLVIVESPAKAKTIEKFLGKDYKVLSSYGHIRDLPKKDIAIDPNNGFEPEYEISPDKKDLVNTLKKNAKEAEMVWLASDEDREGEAIAWHLFETLKLDKNHTKRIVFHEITKNAILNAIENPRDIDVNLVNAQQARRVLDRIVGFELSPVLWKKIKRGLSAGRVQSVAVRLIVDREKEIEAFKTESFYRVVADFALNDDDKTFRAEFSRRLSSEKEARALLSDCISASFTIDSVAVKNIKRSPAPPFTTSTLQQEANRKLGYSVAQTMSIAQRLYEAGYITYMRTDSLNLSSLAIATIKDEITSTMGTEYLKVRKYHTTSKGAQEAHEAIRPTYVSNHDIPGTSQEKRLYNLIWKRTIASQMADAIVERTSVNIGISNRSETFQAQGDVVKFDGFLKVYMPVEEEENNAESNEKSFPALKKGDSLTRKDIVATMRFTQHPPRYNEASLVKKLEELGIGRPSTYAPTISTIMTREYVEKGEKEGVVRSYLQLSLKGDSIQETTLEETSGNEKGKLIPTDTGRIVNDFLEEYFPEIMDYHFTARVEEQFDEIALGKLNWKDEIIRFYSPFHNNVSKTESLRLEHKVGERILGTDPISGKLVSVKIGRFGPVVQIGDTDGNEKPQFASLEKDQSITTITLDEALNLFKLPRNLGTFEDKVVTAAVGRFGPYLRHNSVFVSIPSEISPLEITLEEAIKLIEAKRVADNNKIITTFNDEPDLKVLNGRFGPYISFNKKNYKIPKTTDAATLTLEQCREIIAKQDATPAKPKRATSSRAKTSKKK
ncbi:MAG: type I DNA topoisomerase [Muribaculaceae bacterium]|nr:type I DNA topoisomerase [Muribaculaceae bacterium]